ncbi:hypothetical protein [Ruegeria sp. EL01]|uniref:hypothetical protein n=1 Tax=Ruegeria sp. EL01 TaxID=2107578 RepID=UPI000EA83920|nr:hypothetical protein [Ruegeria sp. EL01]
MITRNTLFSKAFMTFLMLHPQLVVAGDFTGADVLEWSLESQSSFYQTSISMAGIVAARTGNHDEIVTCINGWYSSSHQLERNSYIRNKLRDFSTYHPQGVILAVLEEACGDFDRS